MSAMSVLRRARVLGSRAGSAVNDGSDSELPGCKTAAKLAASAQTSPSSLSKVPSNAQHAHFTSCLQQASDALASAAVLPDCRHAVNAGPPCCCLTKQHVTQAQDDLQSTVSRRESSAKVVQSTDMHTRPISPTRDAACRLHIPCPPRHPLGQQQPPAPATAPPSIVGREGRSLHGSPHCMCAVVHHSLPVPKGSRCQRAPSLHNNNNNNKNPHGQNAWRKRGPKRGAQKSTQPNNNKNPHGQNAWRKKKGSKTSCQKEHPAQQQQKQKKKKKTPVKEPGAPHYTTSLFALSSFWYR